LALPVSFPFPSPFLILPTRSLERLHERVRRAARRAGNAQPETRNAKRIPAYFYPTPNIGFSTRE
jgi:hypothetical protein